MLGTTPGLAKLGARKCSRPCCYKEYILNRRSYRNTGRVREEAHIIHVVRTHIGKKFRSPLKSKTTKTTFSKLTAQYANTNLLSSDHLLQNKSTYFIAFTLKLPQSRSFNKKTTYIILRDKKCRTCDLLTESLFNSLIFISPKCWQKGQTVNSEEIPVGKRSRAG